MSDELVWEEPPQVDRSRPGTRRSKWDDTLDSLRERPGQWANLGEYRAQTAYYLKAGRLGHAKPGEFEATMRGVDPASRRGTLYVRYVGKPNLKSAAS